MTRRQYILRLKIILLHSRLYISESTVSAGVLSGMKGIYAGGECIPCRINYQPPGVLPSLRVFRGHRPTHKTPPGGSVVLLLREPSRAIPIHVD